MGEGGGINLVNYTPCTWALTAQSSNQMNAWAFPTSVASNSITSVHVEWDQDILVNQGDDVGDAMYSVQCSSSTSTFNIQARNTGGFDLQVYFATLSTTGFGQGSTLHLGWIHDGTVTFFLFQSSSTFYSNVMPSDWLQTFLPQIGGKTLQQLALPGSHDAGMSTITGGFGGIDCNTVTQKYDIGQQLALGTRFFDIRPMINDGQYTTGHYGDFLGAGVGATGQSIDSIINDVNSFTASNKELVILYLSHDMDTDGIVTPPLSQAQWDPLLTQLQAGLQNLYIPSNGPSVDLTSLTLNQYIGGGAAVVVVVEPADSSVSLGNFAGQGFFTSGQLHKYDQYSNTDDPTSMETDQIDKFNQNAGNTYFLLSWTVTLSGFDSTTCGPVGAYYGIRPRSDRVHGALFTTFLPLCTSGKIPNIILLDELGYHTPAAAMAAYLNLL